MDNCSLKTTLIIVGLSLTIVGLYLSFLREKKAIQDGAHSYQKAEIDPKGTKIDFTLSIGVLILLFGLVSIFWSSLYIDCIPDSAHMTNEATNEKPVNQHIPDSTRIEGWIIDENNNNIAGAQISIEGRQEHTTSGPDGHFVIHLNGYVEEVAVKIHAKGYTDQPPILKKTNSVSDYIISKIK